MLASLPSVKNPDPIASHPPQNIFATSRDFLPKVRDDEAVINKSEIRSPVSDPPSLRSGCGSTRGREEKTDARNRISDGRSFIQRFVAESRLRDLFCSGSSPVLNPFVERVGTGWNGLKRSNLNKFEMRGSGPNQRIKSHIKMITVLLTGYDGLIIINHCASLFQTEREPVVNRVSCCHRILENSYFNRCP
jgi:hypothetical protein